MRWLELLRQHPDALASYREHLVKHRQRAESDQDAATTWEAAQAALAQKRLLDKWIAELTRSEQEETAYARYVGNAGNHSRSRA